MNGQEFLCCSKNLLNTKKGMSFLGKTMASCVFSLKLFFYELWVLASCAIATSPKIGMFSLKNPGDKAVAECVAEDTIILKNHRIMFNESKDKMLSS